MNEIKQGTVNFAFAEEWDKVIYKYIPFYDEMVANVIAKIPFSSDEEFTILDLGCGTGEISKRIKNKFPKAKINCVDGDEKVLEKAKIKLAKYLNITYELCNFSDYVFNKKYHVIFSVLAIHHLEHEEQKKLYQRIFAALDDNGIFIHAECVLDAHDYLSDFNLQSYYNLIRGNCTAEEFVENKNAMSKEDKPVSILDHIRWLQEIGFKDINIIWRKTVITIFCGSKLK